MHHLKNSLSESHSRSPASSIFAACIAWPVFMRTQGMSYYRKLGVCIIRRSIKF